MAASMCYATACTARCYILFSAFTTHWSLRNMSGILKVQFSIVSYIILAWTLAEKLLTDECHRTSLMRSWHRPWHQAIIWSNGDPGLAPNMRQTVSIQYWLYITTTPCDISRLHLWIIKWHIQSEQEHLYSHTFWKITTSKILPTAA